MLNGMCAGPSFLQELRHLSFRHMIPVMCYSKYAAYALAWQKMWLGCPQLTYINIERWAGGTVC